MDNELFKEMIGKKVLNVYMHEDYLSFETDGGDFTFYALGDCYKIIVEFNNK